MHSRTTCLILTAVFSALLLAGCGAEAGDIVSSAATSHVDGKPHKPHRRVKITHKVLRTTKVIAYSRDTVKTSTLDRGVTVIDQEGRPGVRVRVMRLALKNGVEVGRELVRTYVEREPVDRVKLVGTHVEPVPEPEPAPSNCDSNYAGACVPIASDVDCAGGSGDGPEYVEGPVTVVGNDVYDLNRDDDNIACDS